MTVHVTGYGIVEFTPFIPHLSPARTGQRSVVHDLQRGSKRNQRDPQKTARRSMAQHDRTQTDTTHHDMLQDATAGYATATIQRKLAAGS